MFKTTVDAAGDAASVLFNLPEYRVVAVVRDDHGRREVFVETPVVEAGCPSCGVLSSRVHQRTRLEWGIDLGLVAHWIEFPGSSREA